MKVDGRTLSPSKSFPLIYYFYLGKVKRYFLIIKIIGIFVYRSINFHAYLKKLQHESAWLVDPSVRPLKVSKSRKQNTKFAHTPNNQRKFVHFFALASIIGSIKKNKRSQLINHSYHQLLLFFFFNRLYRLGQKNEQNFISFLVSGRTWFFAFEIYRPLCILKARLLFLFFYHWSKSTSSHLIVDTTVRVAGALLLRELFVQL